MRTVKFLLFEDQNQDFVGSSTLLKPIFAKKSKNNVPYKPSFFDILIEWVDSINILKYPERIMALINFIFHLITFIVVLVYFTKYFTYVSMLYMLGSIFFLITIYNTVWYHRYCSHLAFTFSRQIYTLLFLWTNPFVFREECYAVPHRIHHQYTDEIGDPYGPHLGWFGSYLAIESSQKINMNITEEQYDLLKRSLNHIGFIMNDYLSFKKTGMVENVFYYMYRSFFAQLFYMVIAYCIGGITFVLSWYSAIFISVFLIRDFNWRGHGGNFRRRKIMNWEFDDKSTALNQRFYGYLASEWHNNHHKYPMSANCGFLVGQIDTAFYAIKWLKTLGIVKSYVNMQFRFQKDIETVNNRMLPQHVLQK